MFELEVNPTVINKLQKKQLSCSYCPPNRMENLKRRSKFRQRGWKLKRKTQFMLNVVQW